MLKKFIFYVLTILIIFSSIFIILEFFLQIKYQIIYKKGSHLENFMVSPRIYDPEYGWKLKKNFNYSYLIEDGKIIKKKTNNLGLASNYDIDTKNNNVKILVIGDSFSESLGVNTEHSWPNQLQKLFKINSFNNVDVYNASISGYNLDQYYFRIKEISEKINPNIIIIGFATATDFFDVGRFDNNFIYGVYVGRNFFEVKNKELIINRDLYNKKNLITENIIDNIKLRGDFFTLIKKLMEKSKLYNQLKRNSIIVNLVINFSTDISSLWPSNEIAIKKNNNKLETKKINLIEKILNKISNEFENQSKLYLVHLPNKVEVDKKFWNATFKKNEKIYDRNEPEKKIIKLLENKKINFIPTIEKLRKYHNKNNQEIYLRIDGHYNNIGNYLISKIVYNEIVGSIKKN